MIGKGGTGRDREGGRKMTGEGGKGIPPNGEEGKGTNTVKKIIFKNI
jgi:hypothetical protein